MSGRERVQRRHDVEEYLQKRENEIWYCIMFLLVDEYE